MAIGQKKSKGTENTAGKKNLYFLYGTDTVTLSMRRREVLDRYFRGHPPEVTSFDGTGSFAEYESALSGQSLFAAETAVVIVNPPFLKYILKSKESLAEQDRFLEFLQELGEETFLLITVDGTVDRRIGIVKKLQSICCTEECTLLEPKNAPDTMIRMLTDAGMQVDLSGRAYLEEVLSAWSEVSVPFLQTECDKIALMCGPKKLVGKKLLQFALPDYMNQGIFKFKEALLAKDAVYVMENTDRVFTDISANLKNMGFLASAFRRIKLYREMERNRMPAMRIQSALGIRSSWQYKALQKEADRVRESDAEWFLCALFRYQMESRLGDSRMTIKDLLLQYCMR